MLAYSTMQFARPADCGINLIITPAGDTFYSTTLSNNAHKRCLAYTLCISSKHLQCLLRILLRAIIAMGNAAVVDCCWMFR